LEQNTHFPPVPGFIFVCLNSHSEHHYLRQCQATASKHHGRIIIYIKDKAITKMLENLINYLDGKQYF